MTTYSLVKPRDLTNTTAFSGDLTAKWLYVDNADDDQAEKLSLSALDARYAGAGTYLVAANNLSDLANAATARANLGLIIGTNVQAYDVELSAIAGLTSAADKLPYFSGAGTASLADLTSFARTLLDDANAGAVRTTLELGTIATQNANAVTITGGSITGITDLAIADGGTGASTAQAAINALTQVSAATNEHVLTKDTATGNATWKAAAGGSSLPVVDETAIVYKTGNASITATLDADSLTTARTYALPDVSSTVAVLGTAQTFSAAQTVETAAASAKQLTLRDINGVRLSMAGVNYVGEFIHAFLYESSKYRVGIRSDSDTNWVWYFEYGAGNAHSYQFRGSGGFTVGSTAAPAATMHAYQVSSTGNKPAIQANQSDNAKPAIYAEITEASSTAMAIGLAVNHKAGASVPVAGYGIAIRGQLTSSTTVDQDAGRLSWEWSTATHASRAALGKLTAYYTSTERECIRWEADSSAAKVGFLGATAVARQSHIADPSGGSTQDAEARTAINSILVALENFGFLATS